MVAHIIRCAHNVTITLFLRAHLACFWLFLCGFMILSVWEML